MPLISEIEAVALLKDYLQPIHSIVQGGWDDYMNQYDSKARVVHCSTTRASIIHDHQIERASIFTLNGTDAVMIDISSLKILFIDNRFAVRFKKFDRARRSSNQPTQQVVNFRGQAQLSGLPETHNLEAGYILNSLETEINSINLVCPNGPNVYWDIELHDGQAVEQRVQDMFDRPDIVPEEEEGAIVKGKATAKILTIDTKKDADKT